MIEINGVAYFLFCVIKAIYSMGIELRDTIQDLKQPKEDIKIQLQDASYVFISAENASCPAVTYSSQMTQQMNSQKSGKV